MYNFVPRFGLRLGLCLIFSVMACVYAGTSREEAQEKQISANITEMLKALKDKKHPYLLFTKWENTPGYKHRKEPPYGGHAKWLFYVKTNADRRGGMYAAFQYQLSKEKKYAEKVKAELRQLGGPKRKDHIRLAGERMIDLALAYDWIQQALTPKEDTAIKVRLASFADAVDQVYLRQTNAHDRIMASSGLGAMALALAGYKPKTKSQPADWLKDGTESLFLKDRYSFPPAFRLDPLYKQFCPALRGVCNSGGFCRIGGYRAYWITTLCRWLLIYNRATGRNPLDDFPIARGVMNEVIWESMPNRMDSQQNTRSQNYWAYHKFIRSMLSPEERGAFQWYDTDPKVDKLRWRRTTAGLMGSVYGLCCLEKNLPVKARRWTSFYSPKNEAFVFRRDWTVDSDWFFFKVMNQPIPSHRDMLHHDNMSFELYSRGDYLLSDGGEIKYRMHGYGPEYAIGHNSILINGKGPVKEATAKMYYRFVNPARFTNHCLDEWLNLAGAKMEISDVEIDPIKLLVKKNGKEYTADPLPVPVEWRRTILYPGKEYFLVVDRLKSQHVYNYSVLFHLSSLNIVKTKNKANPGNVIGKLAVGKKIIDWARDVKTDILTGDKPFRMIGDEPGNATVTWNTTAPGGKKVEMKLISSIDADKVAVGRIWGRIASKNLKSGEVDHPFIRFHHSRPEISRITAILTRYAESEKERKVSRVKVEGNGSALKIELGEVVDLVATGRGEMTFSKASTDAEISLVRLRKGKVETGLIIRGTALKYAGRELLSANDASHAAFHWVPGKKILDLHVETKKDGTLVKVYCPFKAASATCAMERPDWKWGGSPHPLKGKTREIEFRQEGDRLIFKVPAGAVTIRAGAKVG